MNALLRILAWTFAVALVLLPVVGVLNGWIGGARWPMRHLVVTGEFRQVSDARVRSEVLPLVQDGFFAVDLGAIRASLAKLPWVQKVEVRKRWPDRLEVALVEYRPMARWGADRMLSERGDIFPAPPGSHARLPLFEGPDDRAAEVMAFHSQARPLFLPAGLQVVRVRLSARGSWNLLLSDETEIEVGRGDPALRLARFARLMPRLQDAQGARIARADLRYTNGFALIWRAPPPAANDPLHPAGAPSGAASGTPPGMAIATPVATTAAPTKVHA
jgi:cell division protein FtsQ